MNTITASLATIPSREDALRNVVEVLLPQVDHLWVYLNGHTRVPECLMAAPGRLWVSGTPEQSDLGDAGKFYHAAYGHPGYRLTCDDDLLYPPDYVETMIGHIERYDREAVITLHGKRYDEQPIESFCRDFTTNCRCLDAVEEDTPVHIPGTGVMAYHTSCVRFQMDDFPSPGMADVYAGLACHRAGVPVVCAAHEARWLQALPTEGETLWRQARKDDSRQTALINSMEWS